MWGNLWRALYWHLSHVHPAFQPRAAGALAPPNPIELKTTYLTHLKQQRLNKESLNRQYHSNLNVVVEKGKLNGCDKIYLKIYSLDML